MATNVSLSKPQFNPVRVLIRPILFAALGLHALLLFTPIPSQPKLQEPDDKKDPVKINQLPTAKPPAAKPSAKVQKAKTTSVSTSTKLANPSTPAASSAASSAAVSSDSLPKIASQPLPPSTDDSANSGANSGNSTKPEPNVALYEILAQLPAPDNLDPAFTNVIRPEALEKPQLFFKPNPDPDLLPEPLAGLASSPIFAPGEEPEILFQTFFDGEQRIREVFEEVTQVGDYGGGPLYRLKQGSYIAYLSLIPTRQAGILGAIVSVWNQDPRKLTPEK